MFWLPDSPDDKMLGFIAWDNQKGTTLTLHGDPFDLRGHCDPDTPPLKVIHGHTLTDHIKLLNCQSLGEHNEYGAFGVMLETHWDCELAFRGDEYPGNIPCDIKSISASIEGLDYWATGFEKIRFNPGERIISWPDEQKQSAPWSLGQVIADRTFNWSWQNPQEGPNKASVQSDTRIAVTFDNPQSWDVAQATMRNLQALVSIASGIPANIQSVSLVIQGETDLKLTPSYRWILHKDDDHCRQSALFTMEELGGIDGIALWLDALNGRENLVNLLLIDRYRRSPFINQVAGNLLLACEAYRRHDLQNPAKRNFNVHAVLKPMVRKGGAPFEDWVGDIEAWISRVSELRSAAVAHLQSYRRIDHAPFHSDGEASDGEGTTTNRASSYSGADFAILKDQLFLLVVLSLLADCKVSEANRQAVVQRMRSDWLVRL